MSTNLVKKKKEKPFFGWLSVLYSLSCDCIQGRMNAPSVRAPARNKKVKGREIAEKK